MRKRIRLTEDQAARLHRCSSGNEEALKRPGRAGCFCCGRVYDARRVREFCRRLKGPSTGPRTAICPRCSVDSVLAERGLPLHLTRALLDEMFRIYFRRTVPMSDLVRLSNHLGADGE